MRQRGLWIAVAIVVPLAIGLVLVPVREQVSSANLALFMLAGAVAVAAASNRVAISVLCAAATALAYDVFLVRPYYSVTIAAPDEVITAVLVLVVVAIVGFVSQLFRHQRTLVEQREENLGVLYQLVDQVASGAGEQSLIRTSERELAELLHADGCRFDDDLNVIGEDTDILDAFIDQIGDVRIEGELWDTEHRGLPDRQFRIPVTSGGLRFGCFLVSPRAGERAARWELIVALMIADLVGSALARWPTDL